METRDLDRIRFVTRHFNDLQGLRYWVPLGLVTLGWGVFAAAPFAFRLPVAALCLLAGLLMLGARRHYRKTFGEVQSQPVLYTADLYPASLSPIATISRIQVPPLRSPAALHFLAIMGTATLLFAIGQVFAPIIRIFDVSPVTLEAVDLFVRPRLWKYPKPIEFGALFAQAVCLLHGSFFLAMWLWRGRRRSQNRYLALGAALLGLAALGTQLGRLVAVDSEPAVRTINFLLPAVVHPWIALFICGSSMILMGLLDHWQLVRALGSAAPGEEEE